MDFLDDWTQLLEGKNNLFFNLETHTQHLIKKSGQRIQYNLKRWDWLVEIATN